MITLSKDDKRLLKYLGIIFIAVLLTYKLPHDSYSIIQYIIRPIRYKSSVIYLAGIIPLLLFIVGTKGLFNLERFAEKNRILLFIAVVAIIIPVMRWTLDFTRTNYHWVKGDGLKAVDMVDANVNLGTSNDELAININLKLIDYSRGQNKFKIRMYLPKTLSDLVEKEFCDLEMEYVTYGHRRILNVEEQIVVKFDNEHTGSDIADSKWYREDFEYELYNEKEVIRIIDHGL